MRAAQLISVLPVVPALAGLALSSWRFRAHDPLQGLAFALAGMILMIVTAIRMPDSGRP